MPATLFARLYQSDPNEELKGFICPRNWDLKIKAIRYYSGISKTGKGQLRKTFVSYHLQAFGDVNLTRGIMGHKTSDVLFTNYRNSEDIIGARLSYAQRILRPD